MAAAPTAMVAATPKTIRYCIVKRVDGLIWLVVKDGLVVGDGK
jgi:hypothetical protein